jgi:hypothetical protein
MVNKAIHKDKGKPDLTYFPYPALVEAARVFEYGAKKYEDYNYKKGKGLSTKTLLKSCLRHIGKYNNGEDIDIESGLPHLPMAMVNLAMIIDLKANGMGGEYRWRK